MCKTTCYITGYRKIPKEKLAHVAAALEKEVLAAVTQGYTRFLTGLTQGSERLAAYTIARLKQQGMPLVLELVLPYPGQQKKTPKENRSVEMCDSLRALYPAYSPNCYLLRDRCMVSQASRVIAVCDGPDSDLPALHFARAQGKAIRIIEI